MRMEAEKKSAEYEKRLRSLEPNVDTVGGDRGSYRGGDKVVYRGGRGGKWGGGGRGGGKEPRGNSYVRHDKN